MRFWIGTVDAQGGFGPIEPALKIHGVEQGKDGAHWVDAQVLLLLLLPLLLLV